MGTKKFLIHISGPGCSGKSSLSEAIGEKFPGTYLVAYDKLKWQLARYHRDTPGSRKLVTDIEWGLLAVVLQKQIPAMTDLFLHDESEYVRLRTLAEENAYKLSFINLTAPREVLLKRFRERVANAKIKGTPISLVDEGAYIENLARKPFIPQDAAIFDTSVTDVKEIAEKISQELL